MGKESLVDSETKKGKVEFYVKPKMGYSRPEAKLSNVKMNGQEPLQEIEERIEGKPTWAQPEDGTYPFTLKLQGTNGTMDGTKGAAISENFPNEEDGAPFQSTTEEIDAYKGEEAVLIKQQKRWTAENGKKYMLSSDSVMGGTVQDEKTPFATLVYLQAVEVSFDRKSMPGISEEMQKKLDEIEGRWLNGINYKDGGRLNEEGKIELYAPSSGAMKIDPGTNGDKKFVGWIIKDLENEKEWLISGPKSKGGNDRSALNIRDIGKANSGSNPNETGIYDEIMREGKV